MTESGGAAFYTRYAAVYDRIATDAPFVTGLRERIVDALDPDRGDVVVEMGCGTGANLPFLRDRVGPGGTVIGLDVSTGVLDRARARIERGGWTNVHVARADATRPPLRPGDGRLSGPVDGVLAAFLTGMLDDPAGTVDDWCRLAATSTPSYPPGRVCVAGFTRSTHPVGRRLNPAFSGLVRLASPPGRGQATARERSPVAVLDERALAAHLRVHERCRNPTTTRLLAGFARVTSGTVAPTGSAVSGTFDSDAEYDDT
jgi:SAM-dependent methyltransferase